MNQEDDLRLTDFDRMTTSHDLQMLKAFLPYIPQRSQYLFSSYIMMKELNLTSQAFRFGEVSPLSACSDRQSPPTIREILDDVKQYGSQAQRDFIDTILNMVQTFNIYQQYMRFSSSFKEGASAPGFFEQLKNSLSPSQQAMFDTYETMFSNMNNMKEVKE